MKQRFVEDGDGHWYLIPDELSSTFWEELEKGEEDYYSSFCAKFDQYRSEYPGNYVVEVISE